MKSRVIRIAFATHVARSICAAGLLGQLLLAIPGTASGQTKPDREQQGPFLTVFPLIGMPPEWWKAEYDHSGGWQETGWRKSAIAVEEAGIRLSLQPTEVESRVSLEEMRANGSELIKAGKTSKKFVSGQVQRNGWFGYGRYEVVMQAAAGEGLISSFYLYTGPYFGDTHEEIDIEVLGKDSTKVQFNRFRDGEQLEDHPWVDLGFDSAEKPRLYAFEWSEDALAWFVDDELLFRMSGANDMPRPPMKIYMDLWAGGPKHADWSGIAPEDTRAEMLVQCVSYSPLEGGTPTCSDLLTSE